MAMYEHTLRRCCFLAQQFTNTVRTCDESVARKRICIEEIATRSPLKINSILMLSSVNAKYLLQYDDCALLANQ